MLNVFIDTNVYLRFFSFAEDDLEELRKLRVAINNGDLKLWITQQTRDELRRNRESKVADSIAALRKFKPSGGIPQMARQLPEFDAFMTARREFDRQINVLTERLSQQGSQGGLAADRVLRELMEPVAPIVVTDQILVAARRRMDLGNPPGKKGSLGDAVNWECLLAACPQGADLYIVTEDADFVSKMDSDRIAGFLEEEWRAVKSSEIRLYRRISSLFQDEFPDIQLASELEKELRVRRLIESESFERTHAAISDLSSYTDYSEQQARDLFAAALRNSQIRWISHDSDVNEFFRTVVDANRELFDSDELARFGRVFADDVDIDEVAADDDIPF